MAPIPVLNVVIFVSVYVHVHSSPPLCAAAHPQSGEPDATFVFCGTQLQQCPSFTERGSVCCHEFQTHCSSQQPMAMHVWIRCEMQFMDIKSLIATLLITSIRLANSVNQSIKQFCTQLTKAYMAERSCSQMLLIEFTIYVCMYAQDQFASYNLLTLSFYCCTCTIPKEL